MGNGSEEAYEEAVNVLSCLALNDASNQLAIATGLVALQDLGSEGARGKLTQMVSQFSEASDMRTAIAEAGREARSGQTLETEPSTTGRGTERTRKGKRRKKSARIAKGSQQDSSCHTASEEGRPVGTRLELSNAIDKPDKGQGTPSSSKREGRACGPALQRQVSHSKHESFSSRKSESFRSQRKPTSQGTMTKPTRV